MHAYKASMQGPLILALTSVVSTGMRCVFCSFSPLPVFNY